MNCHLVAGIAVRGSSGRALLGGNYKLVRRKVANLARLATPALQREQSLVAEDQERPPAGSQIFAVTGRFGSCYAFCMISAPEAIAAPGRGALVGHKRPFDSSAKIVDNDAVPDQTKTCERRRI